MLRHVLRTTVLATAALTAAATLSITTPGIADAAPAVHLTPAEAPAARPAKRTALAATDRSMTLATELSTTAVDTSSIAIPVPAGITPTAVTAVVSQPSIVPGGSLEFSINGAPALSTPSALYQRIRIPVTAANVTVEHTIVLSLASQGAAVAGLTCVPTSGTAALRKLALEYTGTETTPTSVGDFFGPTASQVDVVIPTDANQSMIEAGLTAVAALAERYDDKTPVSLATSGPSPAGAVASQRVVALISGRAGEVTTAVSGDSGVPTLTLTGTGEELNDAARSLSSDALLLGGGQDQDPSTQMKQRSTSTTRTLKGLGVDQLTLQGYGTTTDRLTVKQDDFGAPVKALRLHLVGSHTAFASDSGARLDIRANGALVGSTALVSGSDIDLDVVVPPSRLQSVNDVDISLSVPPPDGAACVSSTASGAEVDIDTGGSTVVGSPGTGDAEGFQLYPQVLQGTLPIAIGATGTQQLRSAIDAAELVVALQRAAASQLDVQVVSADTFLADDRSGLIVGALAQDSVNLDAPLRLSSTRRLDRADSRFAVTSQDPYAVLESIDRGGRFVLMLGSWAPGNAAAPGKLSRKVTDAVLSQEWSSLRGDLVLADGTTPAFTAASRSLEPHVETTTKRSYAGWFVAAIAVLLLLLAFQVVVSIRRDRAVARAKRQAEATDRKQGPAYVEDTDQQAVADDLGDLDDLEVAAPGGSAATRTATRTAAPATSDTSGTSGTSAEDVEPTARRPRTRLGRRPASGTGSTGSTAAPRTPGADSSSTPGPAITPRKTTGSGSAKPPKRTNPPRKPRGGR